MGLFDFFKRNDRVIDLSEKYRKQQEQLVQAKEESKQEKTKSQGFFPFFIVGWDFQCTA